MRIAVKRYSTYPTSYFKFLFLNKSTKGKLLTLLALTIVIVLKNVCVPIRGDIHDAIQGDIHDTCDRRDLSNYTATVDGYLTRLPSGNLTNTDCLTFNCTTSESCDNYLPTNYDGPDPPCCASVLRDMARIFDDTMCDLGLDYVAAMGTLLGLVRSDRLIPWTSDNDYLVPPNSMKAMVD